MCVTASSCAGRILSITATKDALDFSLYDLKRVIGIVFRVELGVVEGITNQARGDADKTFDRHTALRRAHVSENAMQKFSFFFVEVDGATVEKMRGHGQILSKSDTLSMT